MISMEAIRDYADKALREYQSNKKKIFKWKLLWSRIPTGVHAEILRLSQNILIGFIMTTFSRILLNMVLIVYFILGILLIGVSILILSPQDIYEDSSSTVIVPEYV
jgi:hypothetical protein